MKKARKSKPRRPTLYLDTTVWNFSFVEDAPEFAGATKEFFSAAERGVYSLYTSETVLAELRRAPEARREAVRELIDRMLPSFLIRNDEVKRLAAVYIERGALPPKSTADALHVAYATVYQLDILVSWNFRHLANLNRRNRILAINLEEGYGQSLNIVTPLGVLGYEDKS